MRTQILLAVILTTLALFGLFTYADVEGQPPTAGPAADSSDLD